MLHGAVCQQPGCAWDPVAFSRDPGVGCSGRRLASLCVQKHWVGLVWPKSCCPVSVCSASILKNSCEAQFGDSCYQQFHIILW